MEIILIVIPVTFLFFVLVAIYFSHVYAKNSLICSLYADIERLKSELDKAKEFASTDTLTGLSNRSVIPERRKSMGKHVCGFLIDIDHFKKVNDTYGHATGDEVLKRVSQILSKHVRSTDSLVRQGGEEFLILYKGLGVEKAKEIAEDIRKEIEDEVFDVVGKLTVSIGVTIDTDLSKIKKLINKADEALYKAKKEGRNQVVIG